MSLHTRPRPVGTDPRRLIADWVEAGLIRPDQADALNRDLGARTPPEAPHADVPSLLVEGLGYLGGAIIVSASLTLVARYWGDLGSPARVGLAAFAAAGLLVAARVISADRAAAARVRAVLLAADVVSFAALVAVMGHEYGIPADSLDLAAVVTAASTGYAALLWRSNPTVVQQTVTFLALLSAVAVATRELHGPPELAGVAPWGVSLAWLLLAWGGVLKPRGLVEAMAAAGAAFSALTTMSTDAGNGLAVATAVALVAAAVAVRNLALLTVGSVAALLSVTIATSDWFPGALAASVSLLVVGVGLVVIAIVVARRRTSANPPAWLVAGSRTVAVATAALVLCAVTAVVVAVSLAWGSP